MKKCVLFTVIALFCAWRSVLLGTGVYVNEFVAKNTSTLLSQFGEAEDWIELYNDSSSPVNLTGWYLTDSASNPTKWTFPAVVLPSKGYLLVWASGRDTVYNGELHTNFKLDGDGEYLALVRPDGVTVEHAYAPQFPEQETDVSYGMYFAGNGTDLVLSPSQAACKYLVPTIDIGTNWHAAAFDDSGWSDGLTGIGYDTGSSYDDYINTDVQSLMYQKMASIYIRIPFNVDDPSELAGFAVNLRYEDSFAAWLNGKLIAYGNLPNGYTAETLPWNASATATRDEAAAVVLTEVFASSDPQAYLVAGQNFLVIHGINKGTGSSDLLMQAQIAGTLLEEYDVTDLRYFATPTPGAFNTGGAEGFVKDTRFSVDRGFYTNAFEVSISTETPDSEIRYTLDGSTPTAVYGHIYSTPVTISRTTVVRAAAFRAGWQPSDVDTQSYIFPADVIRQPVQPDGWPALWNGGYKDYEMDPDIVDAAAYSSQFPSVLLRVPTLSIVTDQSNLFGGSGIYDNSLQEGVAWERPASVELIQPDGGQGFHVNCGIRMQGGASRNPSSSPKHSFRLLFKDIYGPSKLKFKLFEDSPVDEFDTIVLRAGYNNSWIHWDAGQRARAQYARDLFARRVQSAMGHASSHGSLVHLYVNGLYWGLYNPSERPTADFTSSYLGGRKEEWDTNNSGEITDGDMIAWNTMMSIANGGLAGLAEYQNLMQYCDVINLADYMIINHYIGNADWDHHNFYAGRRRRAGEGYKFFCWDSERGIESTTVNATGRNNDNKPTRVFQKARESAEFRLLFADRLHRHLFNDGPLTAENAAAIWGQISDVADSVVVAESARWGDYRGAYTVNDFYLPQQSWVVNTFFPARTAVLLSQYASMGLYPTLAAPEFAVHGGTFTNVTSVTLTGPSAIYYTLDGSDPRQFGTGGIHGSPYAGPITLEHTTRVKARCFDGSTWSALTEADFHDLAPNALRITEIMHSPRAPDATEMAVSGDADDYKFIELYNGGSETVGLAGVWFPDGIRFDFAGSSVLYLAPGEYAVAVKDRNAFLARYPGKEDVIAGEFLDDFSGSGEEIVVELNGLGAFIEFEYSDARNWPPAACGAGHSLVPLVAEGLPGALLSYGGNWRASTYLDGSPGEADPVSAGEALRLNEIAAHTDLDDPAYPEYDSNDWIELYNAGESPVTLGNFYLSDDPGNLMKWRTPIGTVINPGEFLSFDEISGFHAPFPAGFGIDKAGETILLSFAFAGQVLYVADAIRFKGQENGMTLGRLPDGEGCWVACVPTRDDANQSVGAHPVISELMYHPSAEPGGDDDMLEYVEIYNPAAVAVPLWTTDEGSVVGCWRLSGEVEYDFPSGTVLAAGARVLLVSFDPLDGVSSSVFTNFYGVPPDVALYGPYAGKLSNRGGRVTLEKPQGADDGSDALSWIVVDELFYSDNSPWSVPPDGMGYALHRAHVSGGAPDPASWIDGAPSPGEAAIAQPDLRITLLGMDDGFCHLGFDLLPELAYTLQIKTNLLQNSWQPCTTLMNHTQYAAPRNAAPRSGFFRLQR